MSGSPALRELAQLIARLTYRDMQILALDLCARLPSDRPADHDRIARDLLGFADRVVDTHTPPCSFEPFATHRQEARGDYAGYSAPVFTTYPPAPAT